MKILLSISAGFILLVAVFMAVLFSHGYSYSPPSDKQIDPTAYHDSAECVAKQAQLKTLEAPLITAEKPLSDKLINGPFPLENGQQIYDQYSALRDKVNTLESQYNC